MAVQHPVKPAPGVVAPAHLPAEGSAAFNNVHYVVLVLLAPKLVQWGLPFLAGRTLYLVLFVVLFLPVTIAYWWAASNWGARLDDKVKLPGKPIGDYLEFKDDELRREYLGRKIPYQVLHDAYFDDKVAFKGDVLDVLEYRHDFVSFNLTPTFFKYIFFTFAPEVIMHTQDQDLSQVREHYDRGDDFYEWFLGPRMIYTSGVIRDLTRPETLEELQDNKLKLVCEKLDLQPSDSLLDIGCGWGTLSAFAGANYGCDVTGVTLSENQAKFGTDRMRSNGVAEAKGRVLCCDYRDIPAGQTFTKIVSLEMAEHVGVRKYGQFLRQVYDLLDDDGTFVFQVAGIRPRWQFEDILWGIFMNKYVFPGADASLPLNWVLRELEKNGWEAKQVDVLGVHYSATLHRWYQNWLKNEDKVVAKYGPRWFRMWSFFLASSTIVSRQGGASVYQLTLHKNTNGFDRSLGVKSHVGLRFADDKAWKLIE